MIASIHKKTIIIVLGVILALAGIIIVARHKDFHSPNNSNHPPESANTTSSSPTAQDNFSQGEERSAGNTLSENKGTAVVTDTGGENSSVSGGGISSPNNEIIVFMPSKDTTLVSGQQISGTSKLTSISYRIKDSRSGVIGSGVLQVVKGKFSGNISFSSTATDGQVDVFGVSDTGSEFANITIPVRFK